MDYRVQQVIRTMKSDLADEVCPSDLAQVVNLSYSHLRHLFTVETGLSPAQYLKMLRMQHARQLVEETFLSVKQIMTMVGLKDESHFVRDFKRMYGVSPTNHRLHYLQNTVRDTEVSKVAVYNRRGFDS